MVNNLQKININLPTSAIYYIDITIPQMRLSQRWRTRISTLWYDLRVRHFNLVVLCSISNISYARYIVYFYSRFVIDHKQRKTDISAAYLCQKLDSYCFFYENVLSIYFNYVFIQSYKWFYLRRFILIV